MFSHAMDAQRGGADAIDLDAEMGEEDAEILNHVVRAGVAQHRHSGRQRGGKQGVLGNGVTALGQRDRPRRFDGLVHRAVVEAISGEYVQAEAAEHLEMWLDGAGSKITASGVRQLEVAVGVQ